MKFVGSDFVSSTFFVKFLLFSEFFGINNFLLNFISIGGTITKTFNFHLLPSNPVSSYDVLTLVMQLFLSSVNLRNLKGESFLLSTSHFGSRSIYKRAGQLSERSLKNFYNSLKFSEYLASADYFNGLTNNNKVLSKFSALLKTLRGVRIRYGLGFEYYKTLVGVKTTFYDFKNFSKIAANTGQSGKKFGNFFATYTQESNFLVKNSKSFYSLLIRTKNLYSGYTRVPESEVYYSSNLGILQFTRTGISRKQHFFFFMYSFEERISNMQFFKKLNFFSPAGTNTGSNFRLKKFNTMFFDRVSENLLFGFSTIAKANNSMQKNLLLSDNYDVSKFFFFDEFSDSAFFNRFNCGINSVDLLKVFSDLNSLLESKGVGLSFVVNKPNTTKYSAKLSLFGIFRLNYR